MKRTILPLALVLVLLLLTGCGAAGYASISMSEAAERLAAEQGYVLLDVRRNDEFQQGHLPGAVCLPNEDLGEKSAGALLAEKDQLIFVYCRSGNRSKQASAKLVKLGYTNVVEIGGIMDWPGEIVTETP